VALGHELGEHHLHRRHLRGQSPQAAVELRLTGQLAKPAWQQPPDHSQELAIGGDAEGRLGDRERDQLGVGGLSSRPRARDRK
jgi:hypothetical protein